MSKEEIIEKLKVFDNFKFFEEDHHYELKNKIVGISVTRLIEKYTNEFDDQGMAEKVALKNQKLKDDIFNNPLSTNDDIEFAKNLPTNIQDILENWKIKNEQACEKGHLGHEYAQKLWEGINYQPDTKNLLNDTKTTLDKIMKQADNFYNDYKDNYELIAIELIVGSEESDCASAIDLLLYNKLTDKIALIDIKTNSYITGYNKESYKKKMLIPLHHLNDDAYNHYCIQLSIYQYWLEKYAKLEIGERFIVYFSENIENYEIIETPYLKDEVKKILRDRRERIMGKCIPILIMGKSGSGKSTSLRNLNKDDYSLVNVLNKDLPFKNGRNIQGLATKDYELVKKFIKETPKNIIVIDDFGYIMTDKFVKKATETGYTKFSVIAQEFYNFIEYIKELDGNKRIYLMMHEEKSENGDIAPKTCGKMLDNQICVEGLFNILLRCIFDGKKHKFKTATDGLDVCKSPIDMFQEELIDNDLKFVDDTICEYYGIENKKKKNKSEEDK